MITIQPVVEGHGEISALPTLIRRLAYAGSYYEFKLLEPIRRKYSELTSESTLKKSIELALQFNPDVILVVFDSDDFCPKSDAIRFKKWATASARKKRCEITMANREYEAWFLASIESLRGKCNVKPDATYEKDPEARRSAKEALEELMEPPHYSETQHQVKMTAQFDMGMAYAKSRSFRHFVTSFGRAIDKASVYNQWPPTLT